MWERTFWQKKLEGLFEGRSVVWLYGVRRSGKTVLGRMWPDSEYFDCKLPRVRRLLEDPEAFWSRLRGRRVVLDEIHRLGNPSEVLKVDADHFPSIRVLATGSSPLGASRHFRDTLTGRKHELWLTPMVAADLRDFGTTDLSRRFLRGGLPPFFLNPTMPETDYQDWMDGFWAKDIQELFRLERRHSFQRFFEFDTGFVCYHRGWETLRTEDRGVLWEHFVLNEVQGRLQLRPIGYWRDKSGHEVDLVVTSPGKPVVAIECKASASSFAPEGLRAFSRRYPGSLARVVAMDVTRPFIRRDGPFTYEFVGLEDLVQDLSGKRPSYELSGIST